MNNKTISYVDIDTLAAYRAARTERDAAIRAGLVWLFKKLFVSNKDRASQKADSWSNALSPLGADAR